MAYRERVQIVDRDDFGSVLEGMAERLGGRIVTVDDAGLVRVVDRAKDAYQAALQLGRG